MTDFILLNESLRVSDTERGEPQKIFACRGEGHGQLRVGLDCLLQDGTTRHLSYCPSRRAPLFWSTLCYTLM